MGEAAISLMGRGEQPTEAGWYVVDGPGGCPIIISLVGASNTFVMRVAGSGQPWLMSRNTRFIARIYPDRIGQE